MRGQRKSDHVDRKPKIKQKSASFECLYGHGRPVDRKGRQTRIIIVGTASDMDVNVAHTYMLAKWWSVRH
jgi:hypothetical protein